MGTSGEATGPNLLPASDPGWGPWRGASGDSWPGTRSLRLGVRFTFSLSRPALAQKIVARPGPGKTQPRGAWGEEGRASYQPGSAGLLPEAPAEAGPHPRLGRRTEARQKPVLTQILFSKLDQSLVIFGLKPS